MNVLKPLNHISRHRHTKSTIGKFADDVGLVYFGSVDQHGDEHRIIRGMTVSIHHSDAHYCIGTYDGYDMALVERTDVLKPTPHMKKSSRHRWFIMEFDLHTNRELPHCFVGLHQHSESFYRQLFAKYPRFRSIRLGSLGQYSLQFNAKYKVYSAPEHALDVERMLLPEVSEMISRHFGSLAVEVQGQSVFVYAEATHVSYKLLDAMLKNGVWFARHLDTISKEL